MAIQFSMVLIIGLLSISLVSSRPRVSLDEDIEIDPDQRTVQSIFSPCDPCPAGWGVKLLCNSTQNTVCSPCPSGTWAPRRPHYRPCSPCSKCGDGLYEDLACTSTRDTQCDSCSNRNGHFNEDYKRKCDWKHAPESMKQADQDQDLDQERDQGEEEFSEVRFVDKKTGRPMTLKAISDRLKQMGFGGGDQKEEELEIDDPKIDKDLNQSMDEDDQDQKSVDDQEDHVEKVQKWHEELDDVWSKYIEKRRNLEKSIGNLNEKLDNEEYDDVEDEEDSDPQQKNPTQKMQLMRPFPQMIPTGSDSMIDQVSMDDQVLDDDVQEKRLEINYPPSYHQYPIDSLMHQQKRKVYIMMGMTLSLLITSIICIIWYVRTHRRKLAAYNRVAVVNLSPEEKEIVRQSATQLANVEKPVKRFQFAHQGGYTSLVNVDSTPAMPNMGIRENPFDSYLNGEDVPESRHQKGVHES